MNKRTSLISFFLLFACWIQGAEDVTVTRFRYAGPIEVKKPILADSLNVNGKPFDVKNLLKSSVLFEQSLRKGTVLDADTAAKVTFTKGEKGYALHLLSFYLHTDRYTKGTLEVTGAGAFEVYVDNKSVANLSELIIEPRRYHVVVKYLTAETDTCAPWLKAVYKTKEKANVVASLKPDQTYSLTHIIEGKDFNGVSLSANGKYVLVKYINRLAAGKSETYSQLLETTTGRVLLQDNGFINTARWMPTSNKLYYTRVGLNGTELIAMDPATMKEELLTGDLPKGNFHFSPDETFLLFSIEEEGPKEGPDLVRVLEPSDRLPDFRKRSFIWKYDLINGLYQQLTYGHKTTYLNDVSADSRFLLFSTTTRNYTSRPFSRHSLYKLDLHTMAVDTLWEEAAFVSRAAFSPDAKQLMITGSGDAFAGIGLNLDAGQISNAYDGQLFLYDLATRKAKPLTKDFNPSVSGASWNKGDNCIYLIAEDSDYQRLYACNPQTGKIKELNVSEDVITAYSVSNTNALLYYYGQSVSNANRLYAYDLKSDKSRLVYDLSAEKLRDVKLGDVHDWSFVSAEGTTIEGRYYLPPNFDPTTKYPLIVYYYGGTSPTNRMLEMRYSMHMYAAMGYVVYTLNPSGTTGFGQAFSARHVNAWGQVTADEIIRGTEQFCKEHTFVNEKKIGCIGASYGGFMTQYLQTRTDLFAAAISHAGISALSSYWGEGYWGYGYCSVANADSYPWNNTALFTQQSPLFHADKIKTPLLLLHGSVDTNVPIGESIQMFAALKLLGKTVEFVQVEGENHGIVDYHKRIGWQNSIHAWFAKWLKEEPAWWEALYPDRTL